MNWLNTYIIFGTHYLQGLLLKDVNGLLLSIAIELELKRKPNVYCSFQGRLAFSYFFQSYELFYMKSSDILV